MKRAPPVLVIGLDLGDGALVERWAREGALPRLAGLLETGGVRSLATPADTLHVSAWPSLYTGTHPGEHGVYYTFQPRPGVQGHRRFDSDMYGRPTVWRLLSEAGVRCTVFDAPYTHPEPGGTRQVFDWGVWAHYLGTASTPPGTLRALRRHVGPYALGLEAHDIGLAGRDPEEMSARLVAAVPQKAEAARWLMREHPWDFFFVVFGETHPAAHYCWPAGADAVAAGDDRALRAVYETIDGAIGRLIDAAPGDATVCVVSGDSVAPNHGAWHLLPEVLRRLGYLAEPSASAPGPGDGAGSVAGDEASAGSAGGLVRRVRDALPEAVRKSLARHMPRRVRDALARRVDLARIDWTRTRAFCLPTDLEGYIRVNLAGREPKGIVKGEAYDDVLDELTVALRRLEDPTSRTAVVRDVVRTRRRFPGERTDALPDLVVLWEPEPTPRDAVRHPDAGVVQGASPDARTATHAAPGFLVARGAGAEVWGDVVDVQHVAPALLTHFGVTPPPHLQGER
ncbi:MAG: alkaline phosphatase family protein [Gemmatimonadota bacterium]